MKYAIFGNATYNQEIHSKLQAINFVPEQENPDVVISVGGDGTMLRAVQHYMDQIDRVLFVGIKTGRLGFYTDFLPTQLEELVEVFQKKTFEVCAFNLLEYKLVGKDQSKIGYALNDLAITNPVNTQIIEVLIDGLHFETFRGTGFLLSTPSGSTAYSKSLGGSLIHPKVKAFQLTEMASINNRIYKTISSPLVLHQDQKIILKSNNYENVVLISDGIYESFKDFEQIEATLSNKSVSFVTKLKDDFWSRVQRAFI